jgi:NADH:ubiquinone oxidoreductase subunit 5 (subunit L)/multisubunit Na+/H+ antiporter MnhA subunit
MGLSLVVASLGILLAYLIYQRRVISAKNISEKFGFFYDWSLNKFYFDENYNRYLYQPCLRLAHTISWLDWEFYDKYFINGFGKLTKLLSNISGKFDYSGIDQGVVDGFGRASNAAGKILRNVQTGRLQNYLLFVVAGILVIIIAQAF